MGQPLPFMDEFCKSPGALLLLLIILRSSLKGQRHSAIMFVLSAMNNGTRERG